MASSKATKTTPKTETKSLEEQLLDIQSDLLEAKKSHRAGELVNPRVVSGYRKQVARIKTQMSLKAKENK
ncbi:50S ribosomal protein L29 [Candidatus Saccharibacteria bacterium]|nr:50S ribosomal protein L29 [Candidatus Saccharibacteria bacterium]